MGRPVVYFELGCTDREPAAAFYAALFGWSTAPGDDSTPVETNAGRGIDGHIVALGHEPHRYTLVYVDVDDLDATIARATELGGTTVVPPTQIPDGRFAWLADPQGTTIGLIEQAAP